MLCLLGACSDRSAPDTAGERREAAARPTQVVARVNGEEITVHQLNERLAALDPTGAGAGDTAQSNAAQLKVLDRLIELTLIRQEAESQGLAQSPTVLRQLQEARTEVLARAWVQQVGEDEMTPSPTELRRYFDEHPHSFMRRRVFVLQELRAEVPRERQEELLRRLPECRDAQAFGRWLNQAGHRWAVQAVQKGSESLSAQNLKDLESLRPGQAVALPEEAGLRVWWLQSSMEQPIAWPQAQPIIERVIMAQRRIQRAGEELQRLRAQARVEYVGAFSREPAPSSEPEAKP